MGFNSAFKGLTINTPLHPGRTKSLTTQILFVKAHGYSRPTKYTPSDNTN